MKISKGKYIKWSCCTMWS